MNNGANKTSDQIQAANRYHSYRNGWMHGAAIKAMDPVYLNHPDRSLAEAYQNGYKDGQIARRVALELAEHTYGHTPTILRLAGE